MKKIVAMILSVLLVSLAACNSETPLNPSDYDADSPENMGNENNEVTEGSETDAGTPEQPEDTAVGILGSFSATDLEENEIDESVLAEYQLTMVNVWATFCSPCIREMPDLGELAGEYEEQGVQIVGLVSDVLDSKGSLSQKQIDTAKEIVDKAKADYLHILPSEELFGLLYQITSVPTTFFVDAEGNQVGSVYVGSKSKETWKTIIDETLKEVSE